MPTVNLKKADIDAKLGKMSETDFEGICFNFGLELDEVTSEYEMAVKERGEARASAASKAVVYKVEVAANRYDLLCVEGLTRALEVFQQRMVAPRYRCIHGDRLQRIVVTSATKNVRPYLVAAILRDVALTKTRYESFIALQDKLHQNIGRKRSLVSIGTHDLDTLKGPFLYDARCPRDITFKPLNETREFTAEELMTYYSGESHLKPYLPIIRDFKVYPVIYDSNGTVLSLPPIINGDHSKIKLTTKNILIEITATDLHKANVTLDTMVTMFSEYCSSAFEIEPVEIVRSDGACHKYPELLYREESVSVDYINKLIGSNLQAKEMANMLCRMGLTAEVTGSVLTVEVPPTRHDILHRCDIAEDVAIAVGYDVISEDIVLNTPSIVSVQLLSKLTDNIRLEMVKCQFTEILTFVLCSKDDISKKIEKPIENNGSVHIGNPKTQEFQVARTTLLPGILGTIQNNQNVALPLRLFEVQDVVLQDAGSDVGCKNERRLCAVYYGMIPEFESLLDVLHSIMSALEYKYGASNEGQYYTLEDTQDSTLMNGRSFVIKINNFKIGTIGIIRPKVLKNFHIKKGMASMLEIEVEHFL